MKREVHWRQVWAEVGLLLLGVALAFVGDSLWDQRRERTEEAEYIVSLRTDFATNRSALDEMVEFYEEVLYADSVLLAYTQYGDWKEAPDSLLSITMRAFTMEYFRPALGTYSDMVGSGKLQILQNSELRASLASFVEEAEVLQGAIDYLGNRWTSIEEPFMIENLPTVAIFDGYPRELSRLDEEPRAPLRLRREGESTPEIPRSDELANMVALRMVLVRDVLAATGWVRTKVTEVQAALY